MRQEEIKILKDSLPQLTMEKKNPSNDFSFKGFFALAGFIEARAMEKPCISPGTEKACKTRKQGSEKGSLPNRK